MNQLEHDFVRKLYGITEDNLANEQFGPEELAARVGISHSGLHRKMKRILNLSISQFIRNTRLEAARKLLLSGEFTASEIAYKVGFGSPTYFNKCFHEQFGVSPGEYKKSEGEKKPLIEAENLTVRKRNIKVPLIVSGALIVLIMSFLFFGKKFISNGFGSKKEKSIAVLPIKYLGENPNKQYLADGMMDAVLLQLSGISDLRVMSRTSVEQYRNTKKTVTKICNEQNVTYLLEGSYQSVGDSIKLIFQLIERGKEKHLWAKDYIKSQKEVFAIQNEVARAVADELDAIITPEERQRIAKFPTLNLTAYDFYQKARDEHWKFWIDNKNLEALKTAGSYYHKALHYDPGYAEAYSGLAIFYWDKNFIKTYLSNSFLDSAMYFANKALSLDSQLSEAYKVSGDIYMETGKQEQAIANFNQAIKINPNYWEAYLSKGILYDFRDAVISISNCMKAASLHRGPKLPNLLATLGFYLSSSGFTEEGKYYANEVFKITGDSSVYFSALANIEGYKQNWNKKIEYLWKAYKFDSDSTYNRIIRDLGATYTYLHQYDQALKCYQKLLEISEKKKLTSFVEMHRIGYSYWMNGLKEEAKYYFDLQLGYSKKGIELQRSYNPAFHYDLAGVYAFRGEKEKAYEHLDIFLNSMKWKHLWIVTLIKNDPLFDNLRSEPRFQIIIEGQFKRDTH
jgi:TolB-like protein/AraC-like DNA-binding protein